MATYTAWICERIRCGDPEAFLGAHEVLREFRLKSVDGGGCEPWAARILAEPPRQNDIDQVREALLDALANGNDLSISSAAFALGALEDPTIVPVLREQLHRQLRALMRQNAALGNIVIALANSGEEVLSGGNHNAAAMEKTIEDARNYLKRFGIVVPW